jgi:hypothetical protein
VQVQKDHYLVATGGWQISEEASLVSIARQMAIFPAFCLPLAAAGRNEAQSPIPAAVILPGHGPIGKRELSPLFPVCFVSFRSGQVKDSRFSRNGRWGFSRGNTVPTALPAVFWRVNMRPALIIDDPIGSGWSSFC